MEEIVFPNQIRMARRRTGVSMQVLADRLRLSISAISKIEKGYRRLDEHQLKVVSDLLRCPVESLLVTERASQPEVIRAWKSEQERRHGINAGSGFKTLGVGLRYIRGQKKLTLAMVAQHAKISLAVYHRIEMGQREVDEKTFAAIARALGMSETDLQLKIYELDMSGALDDLKGEIKSGIYAFKGGYNDLPISLDRPQQPAERAVPICGTIRDGRLALDRNNPDGAAGCPASCADADAYAVRFLTPQGIIPARAVAVIAPNARPQPGDLCVAPNDGSLRLCAGAVPPGAQKIVFIHMP
ncbi:MAG: helix-turn-helix transcriptional regulator [Alphaproteobacteria bacterium]|nr:helix-turn-helix transcriptional regulator [Alphaproteobacteria bacterium]